MLLTLSKRGKDKAALEVVDDEGQTVYQKVVNRFNEKDIRFVSRLTQKSVIDVTNLLNSCCEVETDDPEYNTHEINPPEDLLIIWARLNQIKESSNQPSTFELCVREIQQLKKDATVYSDDQVEVCLKSAFNHIGIETLIEWTDDTKLSCLDIDYHNIDINFRPNEDELCSILDRIKPQPYCWHVSHGRGAKLYYLQHPGYPANELATMAGFHWGQIDPRATFELTKSTRHPLCDRRFDNSKAPCQTVESIYIPNGLNDLTAIKKLLTSEVDYDDVINYLTSKNYSFGQTLPHTECPIEPDTNSKQCVYIGEKGIFCHRCSAKGISFRGFSTPGLVPYSLLVGSLDNRLRKLVKNFVHYEHARIVLSNLYPNINDNISKILYRIMLKIVHGPDDPRINLTFLSGKGFVRIKGMWVSKDGEEPLKHNESDWVRSLPATMQLVEDGFARDVSTLTAFQNSCDLEEYGYDNITFIRGCKIYGQKLPYKNGEIVQVNTRKEFRDCPPTYIPLSKRMKESDAWAIVDSEFPGIDQNYLRLLIAAKGAAEGRLTQCPFILVTGPAGAGKSTVPHIAAGICGDKGDEPLWMPDTARFRQGLMEAARHSSFVIINEIFKEASKVKMPYTQALDPMLSLTEDSRSWEMHIGHVAFGRLPVFVCTDVKMPQEIKKDIQLSRRFVFYALSQRNYWEKTFVNKHIRPHEFRLISSDHASAADAILSYTIDKYFTQAISLTDIANDLQIQTFEEQAEEYTQSKPLLKLLYDAVIQAPPLEGSHAARYKPEKGWKLIDRGKMNVIMKAWDDVADGQEKEEWCKSRIVDSEDWSKLLGVDIPIICDTYVYRPTQLYIRFRSTENHKNPMWINGKIVKIVEDVR